MPSQPSLQACSKRTSPSPSKNSFKTIPACGPRTSFASLRLRSSMGRRRKSSPSSAIRSKAISTASPPWRLCRIRSNTARPLALVTMASPSIRNEFAGRAATAAAASGKRLVKSFPLRVINRTPAGPRRARIRSPSCLISCSHFGPEGGALAGDGRQGSIIPNPGRVRSRNDMRV